MVAPRQEPNRLQQFLQTAPAGGVLIAPCSGPCCPACGQLCGLVQKLVQSSAGRPMLMLCAACGHLGIFAGDRVRDLTADELAAVQQSLQWPQVKSIQDHFRRASGQQPPEIEA